VQVKLKWRRSVNPLTTGKGPVVRKILKATEAVSAVTRVSIASFILALIGITLYKFYYPSGIILFEAFVWLIEALSFFGVAVALKIAGSRTIAYRLRYEFLRLEAISSVILSIIGLAVTATIIEKALIGKTGESTPAILAMYPLGSAVASYILEKYLHKTLHGLEFKIVSINVIISKLKYDVIVEAGGGTAILASSLVGLPLIERVIIVAIGLYVTYGLAGIIYSNMQYIIGPGPEGHRREIKNKILSLAKTRGYNIRKVRVELYGTFAEAEVWIEMNADITLKDAHSKAIILARDLVHKIPELLRVLVITVPSRRVRRKRYIRMARGNARRLDGHRQSL